MTVSLINKYMMNERQDVFRVLIPVTSLIYFDGELQRL
jgi:hypothetical protein